MKSNTESITNSFMSFEQTTWIWPANIVEHHGCVTMDLDIYFAKLLLTNLI